MRSIRIKPLGNDKSFMADVVCDCGRNALRNTMSRELSTQHPVTLGGEDVVLECTSCGTTHRLHPQRDHFHVVTNQVSTQAKSA